MNVRGFRSTLMTSSLLIGGAFWILCPDASRSSAIHAESKSVAAASGGPSRTMSWFSLRSTLKQAKAAKNEARLDKALELYQTVVEGAPVEQPKRAEALYWTGLLRLSSDPRLRDLERARAALENLKSQYPQSERRTEAGLALALAEDVVATRSTSETLVAEAVKGTEACRSEKEDLARRVTALEEEAKVLKTEVESLRAESASLREDMKKKDEALRKVKEVIVGWKPSR